MRKRYQQFATASEAFHEAGTPFIVGHPGGESVELMEATRNRGMRFILVKQESAGHGASLPRTATDPPVHSCSTPLQPGTTEAAHRRAGSTRLRRSRSPTSTAQGSSGPP